MRLNVRPANPQHWYLTPHWRCGRASISIEEKAPGAPSSAHFDRLLLTLRIRNLVSGPTPGSSTSSIARACPSIRPPRSAWVPGERPLDSQHPRAPRSSRCARARLSRVAPHKPGKRSPVRRMRRRRRVEVRLPPWSPLGRRRRFTSGSAFSNRSAKGWDHSAEPDGLAAHGIQSQGRMGGSQA